MVGDAGGAAIPQALSDEAFFWWLALAIGIQHPLAWQVWAKRWRTELDKPPGLLLPLAARRCEPGLAKKIFATLAAHDPVESPWVALMSVILKGLREGRLTTVLGAALLQDLVLLGRDPVESWPPRFIDRLSNVAKGLGGGTPAAEDAAMVDWMIEQVPATQRERCPTPHDEDALTVREEMLTWLAAHAGGASARWFDMAFGFYPVAEAGADESVACEGPTIRVSLGGAGANTVGQTGETAVPDPTRPAASPIPQALSDEAHFWWLAAKSGIRHPLAWQHWAAAWQGQMEVAPDALATLAAARVDADVALHCFDKLAAYDSGQPVPLALASVVWRGLCAGRLSTVVGAALVRQIARWWSRVDDPPPPFIFMLSDVAKGLRHGAQEVEEIVILDRGVAIPPAVLEERFLPFDDARTLEVRDAMVAWLAGRCAEVSSRWYEHVFQVHPVAVMVRGLAIRGEGPTIQVPIPSTDDISDFQSKGWQVLYTLREFHILPFSEKSVDTED